MEIPDKTAQLSHCAFASRYNKWATEDRPVLFQRMAFCDGSDVLTDVAIPKIGNSLEHGILQQFMLVRRPLGTFISKNSHSVIYLTRKLSYFVQILGFVPRLLDEQGKLRQPSELKELPFDTAEHASAALAVLNSSLFYWWLSVLSDCRNLNKREIFLFPCDLGSMDRSIRKRPGALADDLMADLRRNARLLEINCRKHGTLRIECIYPRLSKPIVDQIDGTLAQYYGFDDEQLDAITNFDVKYRMGQNFGEDE